jgi:hypothetical protein
LSALDVHLKSEHQEKEKFVAAGSAGSEDDFGVGDEETSELQIPNPASTLPQCDEHHTYRPCHRGRPASYFLLKASEDEGLSDTCMSVAGLSRCHIPGPSSSMLTGSTEDDEHPASRSSLPPHSNGTSHHHTGSAFEGGGKVAYELGDLDLDGSEEARLGGKMPRLTIMEEVLLLGLKDKQVCIISSPGVVGTLIQ